MPMITSKCVGVVSLRYPAKGDTRGSRQEGRDKLHKGGPHDTEGVRYTLARNLSIMNEFVIGVTPLDTSRKNNSDNY